MRPCVLLCILFDPQVAVKSLIQIRIWPVLFVLQTSGRFMEQGGRVLHHFRAALPVMPSPATTAQAPDVPSHVPKSTRCYR